MKRRTLISVTYSKMKSLHVLVIKCVFKTKRAQRWVHTDAKAIPVSTSRFQPCPSGISCKEQQKAEVKVKCENHSSSKPLAPSKDIRHPFMHGLFEESKLINSAIRVNIHWPASYYLKINHVEVPCPTWMHNGKTVLLGIINAWHKPALYVRTPHSRSDCRVKCYQLLMQGEIK